jgi:peptide/nickel transport system permease protein
VATPTLEILEGASVKTSSQKHPIWATFLRNRVALASLGIYCVLVILAVFAPLIAPNPNGVNLAASLQGPSFHHLLGTDQLGRDMLSRLIAGARVDLSATLEALVISAGTGIPLGLLAGYVGGWVDVVLSRIADAILAFPFLILAIGIVGMLGPGLTDSMVAVGVVLAPRFFRVARSAALAASREGFVEAAIADGCTTRRILFRYVLPEASGSLLVQTSYSIGLIISAEASLGFLGLGVRPPQASWGSMIGSGFSAIRQSSYLLIPPSVIVIIAVGAAFLLGDGLRDAIHSSTSRRR